MKMSNTFYASTVSEWREWLQNHHAADKEVWLIFYKVHTGRPCISYDEALDEALCWGWIDSIIQKIDEDSYGRKFTPRTNTAKWSEVNQRKVARLLREGRMTEAGLSKLGDLTREGLAALESAPKTERPKMLPIPAEVEAGLKANPAAWENFQKMAPSKQRNYIGWITSAKKQETLERRIQEAIQRLEQNLPLGMK